MKPRNPLIRFLSSYILGIIVLLFMMLLLVLGTLWQAQYGLLKAQEMFYQSYVLLYPVGTSGLAIPLPGSRLLMVILFVNLLLATIFRMKPQKRLVGVYIVHVGILVLLVGGFFTAYGSYEGYMELREGGASNFSTRYNEEEIVVARESELGVETVTAIRKFYDAKPGERLLEASAEIPFSLEALAIHPNSVVEMDPHQDFAQQAGVNDPKTRQLAIRRVPPSPNASRVTAGVFRATPVEGEPVTFILADSFNDDVIITVDGTEYRVRLRNQRDYYPFSIYLRDFKRETHPGITMNKSYESFVTLVNPETNEERRLRIYMNHPLRYHGLTFYQASFGEDDKVSVLQVVKNAGLVFPYVATILTAIGLTWQFVWVLMSRASLSRRLAKK